MSCPFPPRATPDDRIAAGTWLVLALLAGAAAACGGVVGSEDTGDTGDVVDSGDGGGDVPGDGADGDADAGSDAEADVEADVEEDAGPVCGNGVVETGEECDGDPDRSCTTSCGSAGTQSCAACAWSDCGVPAETCNGADDDCDGATDEDSDEACYEGASGTEGVGRCVGGTRYCLDGTLGPCLGQVRPAPEACNLLDDDCDGETDEDSATLSCGVGACRTTTPACAGGRVQSCTPGSGSTEVCGDGVDDDCDTEIDEGCGCIYVAPFGRDSDPGTSAQPVRTIQHGIALAGAAGGPRRVCVAADTGCPWTFYDETVTMSDGVSVEGGYDPNTWARSNRCTTEIRGQDTRGVYFGPIVARPTALDGFVVSIAHHTAATSAVLTVEGSTGALVTGCSVYGSPDGSNTYGIHVLADPAGTAATPTIIDTLVEGGDGTDLSVGIYSIGSAPRILRSCRTADLDAAGRCTGGCGSGLHVRGYRTGTSAVSYGILLEDSAGSIVDQVSACTRASREAAAIRIVGDAAGTVISRSDAGTWGAAVTDYGVHLDYCAGAAPWIGDNARLWAEGDAGGAAVAVAVQSTGDCHPVIEANQLIVGGLEATSSVTKGVRCSPDPVSGVASRCVVVGNVEIRGSNAGYPATSTGVDCEGGACGAIVGNALIRGRGGDDCYGLRLEGPSGVLVDGNVIEGGCGRNVAIGVFASDAVARIQNNVVRGGTCSGVATTGRVWFGAMLLAAAGTNEVDLHSNAIDGGGLSGTAACTSAGVVVDLAGGVAAPGGPRGVVRNNVVEAGSCPTRYAFQERDPGADPRILENNDLLWASSATALYHDETATLVPDAAGVNAMTDIAASGNIDGDPVWTLLPSGLGRLDAASPCRNGGTAAGAPAWDFEGDARPQEAAPDIGPDEYVP